MGWRKGRLDARPPYVDRDRDNYDFTREDSSCAASGNPAGVTRIQAYNTLTKRDGLAFYPDWPTPTFYDQLVAGTQELLNGTKSPKDVLTELGDEYQAGVDEITNQ